MATIIDSLFIELGLDTKKFTEAQKESIDLLKKFETQSKKSNEFSQKSSRDTADGFLKLKDSLISLGVAFLGASTFKDFVKNVISGNAELGRNAQLLNISVSELSTWGGVLQSVGGNVEEFQGSLKSLQQGIAGIKLGNSAILSPLARLGALDAIDINKGTVDLYKLSDALKRFKDQNGQQLTFSLAQQLGISEKTFLVLENGSESTKKLYNEYLKLNGVTERSTQSARDFEKQFSILKKSSEQLSNSIVDDLYPALTLILFSTTKVSEFFGEADKKSDGFLSKLLLISASAISLKGALSALKFVGISSAKVGLSAAVGTAGTFFSALLHSPELNKNEDEELKKFRDNAKISPKKMDRNFRNNNPGNLEYNDFTKSQGAIGSDGRFAIFKDLKSGETAQLKLLMNYLKKGRNTISSIISRWAPSNENNTAKYIEDVSKKTGFDPNKVLSINDLPKIQAAITAHEGMIGAKISAPSSSSKSNISSETNIGTINVNTNATNANGISKSIGESIKNNSLINSGIVGNR